MLFCVAVQFGQIYPHWLVFSCLKNKKKNTLKKQKDYLKDYLKDDNKSDSLERERFVLSPSKFSLLLRRYFFFFFFVLTRINPQGLRNAPSGAPGL